MVHANEIEKSKGGTIIYGNTYALTIKNGYFTSFLNCVLCTVYIVHTHTPTRIEIQSHSISPYLCGKHGFAVKIPTHYNMLCQKIQWIYSSKSISSLGLSVEM